jgi:hypothetical protein
MDMTQQKYALFQPQTLLRSCLEETVNAHVVRLLKPAKAADSKPDLNYAVAGGSMLPCYVTLENLEFQNARNGDNGAGTGQSGLPTFESVNHVQDRQAIRRQRHGEGSAPSLAT